MANPERHGGNPPEVAAAAAPVMHANRHVRGRHDPASGAAARRESRRPGRWPNLRVAHIRLECLQKMDDVRNGLPVHMMHGAPGERSPY